MALQRIEGASRQPLTADRIAALQSALGVPANTASAVAAATASAAAASAAAGAATADLTAIKDNFRGWYDISRSPGLVRGAVSDAQRVANAAAMVAGINLAIAQGIGVYIPPGRYEYTATGVQAGRNVGLQIPTGLRSVIGAGPGLTDLVQYAVGHPVLTYADVSDGGVHTEHGCLVGLRLGHGVSQAGQTAADGLLLGRMFFCVIDRIEISPWLGTSRFDPTVGVRIGVNNAAQFFSNEIGTLAIRGGQQHVILVNANSTGNAARNIYCAGGEVWGARLIATDSIAKFANPKLTFGRIEQLNIEWCSPGDSAVALDTDMNLQIGVMHVEGIKLRGFNPAVLRAIGNANVTVDHLKLLNNWMDPAAITGTPRVVSTYDSPHIDIRGLTARWDGVGVHAQAVCDTQLMLFAEHDTSIVGRRPECRIGDAYVEALQTSGALSDVRLDAVSAAGTFPAGAATRAFGEYVYDRVRPSTTGASIVMGDADLVVVGMHRRSKVTLTTPLTANRAITLDERILGASAVKRTAGDTVHVYRQAAGAFDLVVKDGAGATLHTFSGAGSANTERFFEMGAVSWTAL